MPVRIDARIPFRIPDATRPGLALTIFLAVFLCDFASAQNPVVRDVEIRSFLGEPLNLRIALAASTEIASSVICQSVIDDDRRENALRSTDLVLTMVELRESRYLQVRSRGAYNDPVARFSLRIGCPGEPIVDREFTALLDPPPFASLPVLPATARPAATPDAAGDAPTPASTKSKPRAKPVVPVAGTWVAIEGDTLTKLAKAIHPRNRARQRQYIAALRDLNSPLATMADEALLPSGTQLALPDLQTLSGILPITSGAVPPVAAPSAAAPAPAIPKPVPAIPKPAPVPQKAAVRAVPESIAKPPAPLPAAAKEPKPATAKPEPAKAAVTAPVESRGASFQLRLSGAQMDLSRSRNVTDEQRNELREKQLVLDADDQVAALLSLRNTVKQLEQRLNQMQLKASTTTAVPSSAASGTPPAASSPTPPKLPQPAAQPPSPPATIAPPIVAAKPAGATTATAPAPIVAAPAPAAPRTATPVAAKAVPAAIPEAVAAAVPADSFRNYLPSPWVAGGIGAGLALLLGAWVWSRSAHGPRRHSILGDDRVTAEPEPPPPPVSEMKFNETAPEEEHPEWADLDVGATVRLQAGAEQPGESAGDAEIIYDPAEYAVHAQIDAPVVFDDTPARYELDSNPATTVDFLVGMDEKLPEDRVRRLQYMHGRYPELQTNTVSIDDADSVINAARLYYDESDKGSGADKACELLTFAVEERPQQVRYWLAQFEIFRLENRVTDFSTLASKFHVLFSHSPSWPKVRHIGNELDPGNTLFAGGSASLANEGRFDPIAENWLNAPMDFTSDALMSDLRQALLDDHHVSRADFDSITAHLTAAAVA